MPYTPDSYAAIVASALNSELGQTHRAVKTIRRWTGAAERTATNWLNAETGPSGPHLAMLAQHSDTVLEAFLIMAGRERVIVDFQLLQVRAKLVAAIAAIDSVLDVSRHESY